MIIRRVLVTTDDGPSAGFSVLDDVAREKFKEVFSIRTLEAASGKGSAATLRGASRKRCAQSLPYHADYVLGDGATPVDCVRFGLWKFKPDLVLVGINNGANIGRELLASSTFCCALYAAQHGVPAIAFSQHWRQREHCFFYQPGEILDYCLKQAGSRLVQNVNLPDLCVPGASYQGIKNVGPEQGLGGFVDEIVETAGLVVFEREFKALSPPERYLVQGYAVVQSWGEGGFMGHVSRERRKAKGSG